jgi:hypothetical protein
MPLTLTWDLVCFAVPTSPVELVWKAVRARHPGRQFHLPPPMCEVNQFSPWSRKLSGSARFGAIPWRRSCPSRRRRCAGCLRGGRARRRRIVRAVVAADGGCHTGLPASQRRRAVAGVRPVVHLPEVVPCTRLDGALAACVAAGHSGAASHSPRLLLTAVVTLGCLLVNEVARLQVSSLWFIYLRSYLVPGFEGTCGGPQPAEECHAAQGPLPAFGRSWDPEQDVAAQLRRRLELAGLAVHPSCAGEGTAAGRARMSP